MKTSITRYKCDAPDCKDKVDIEGTPDTPTTAIIDTSAGNQLPDGWIELAVTGSSPGGAQAMVHASTPECAEKLAAAQVEIAVEVAEAAKKETEERERQQKEAQKEGEKEARKQQKEAAKRAEEALIEEEKRKESEAEGEDPEQD